MSPQDSKFEPRILAFCCQNSLYGDGDYRQMTRPRMPGVKVVELPCGGKADQLYLLKAIEAGYDAVVVLACPEGECRLINGTLWAERRVGYVNRMMEEIGIVGPRAFLIRHPAPSRPEFENLLAPVIEQVRELGPTPIKLKAEIAVT